MAANAKIGVFLCQCGSKIDPLVDLQALQGALQTDVDHCEILPYTCLQPGLESIMHAVAAHRLNRLIIAGCESRLMLKKFEKELAPLDLLKGQIDMINVRGHIAAVSEQTPEQNAAKAAKLIKAAVAEMHVMSPTAQIRAKIDGPVVIVGNGLAGYAAAQALADKEVDCLLCTDTLDADAVLRKVSDHYPGEGEQHPRLRRIVTAVAQSPRVTLMPPSELVHLAGVTGDYTLTFQDAQTGDSRQYRAGALLAALDAELVPPGPQFGYDGDSVLYQPELERRIRHSGTPKGKVVFWVNDHEIGMGEFDQLSVRAAWSMARHIRETSNLKTETIILYNEKMPVSLSSAQRAVNRKLKIAWVPYDQAVRPMVQDRCITFCGLKDHVEHEIDWDLLVLSPLRRVGGQALQTAKTLGLIHKPDRFLTGHHAKVRPEMVGREATYLAGSARYPCDLQETLNQGRRAGVKNAAMVAKAGSGELFVPRTVCWVDPELCIGCGQCQELCDCGGISVDAGAGGGLPRVVDPMVCTGGGTCAAACPYRALILQNFTNDQREARLAALANQLEHDDVVVFGCAWGGLPAADNAGTQGLKYDPRIHMIGIPCIGQLDPCVMARAFLEGAPGLLLLGCLPEECHHSYGVDHAWNRVSLIKKLLTLSGFNRRRIALAHADLNKPEEFIRTVESFSQTISSLGPIDRTAANRAKLAAMYDLAKNNTRIRALLSAVLRRPWENAYTGDQRHALEYDRDFSDALVEEFLQARLLGVLKAEKRPLGLTELSQALHEEERRVIEALMEMVREGLIASRHENRRPYFACVN